MRQAARLESVLGPITTMPKHYYIHPAVFEEEKKRIFHRHWQWVGHLSELPRPGSFFATSVVGEPLLVVRGDDDVLRAFYNVCQHRGHVLARGHGECERFVCPYHGWTYGTRGELSGARGTAKVPGFDLGAIRLREVRLEILAGLLFVNLDPGAEPLAKQIAGLEREILAETPELPGMKLVAEHVIEHESNWKVSIENFNECYHCPVAHRYLVSNVYHPDDYRISFDGALIRHRSKGYREPSVHGAHLLIWFIWPNLAVELYPLHRAITLRHFRPIGWRRTDYLYQWYTDPDLPDEHVGEVVEYARVHRDTTGREDEAIVREVQNGLESQGYEHGRLVITPEPANESENSVAHLQSFYLEAMGRTKVENSSASSPA